MRQSDGHVFPITTSLWILVVGTTGPEYQRHHDALINGQSFADQWQHTEHRLFTQITLPVRFESNVS